LQNLGLTAAASVATLVYERFVMKAVKQFDDSVACKAHLAPVTPSRSIGTASTMPSTMTLADTPFTGDKIPVMSHTSTRKTKLSNNMSPQTPARLKASARTPKTLRTDQTDKRADFHPVIKAIVGMLQKLATYRHLNDTNIRASCVDTICRCLVHLPPNACSEFICLVLKMCHAIVPEIRLVGIEVASFSINDVVIRDNSTFPRWIESSNSNDTSAPSDKLVVLSDRDMPAALFSSLQGRLVDVVQANRIACANAFCGIFKATRNDNYSSSTSTMVRLIKADSKQIASTLRRLAQNDDKVHAKNAALRALVELLMLGEEKEAIDLSLGEEEIWLLSLLCQDTFLSTKKVAAEALSKMLEFYVLLPNPNESILESLEATWSEAVLPLVNDAGAGVAKKSVEMFLSLVLNNIILCGDDDHPSTQSAWRILANIGKASVVPGSSQREFDSLKVALAALMEGDEKLCSSLIKTIQRVAVAASYSVGSTKEAAAKLQGVWCLFNALMGGASNPAAIIKTMKRARVTLDFVADSLSHLLHVFVSGLAGDQTTASIVYSATKDCLEVISHIPPSINAQLTSIATTLEPLLSNFSLPPELIKAAIAALVSAELASAVVGELNKARTICETTIEVLYVSCEQTLASSKGGYESESRLIRALCTVGELRMIGFNPSDVTGGLGKKKADEPTQGSRGINVRPWNRLTNFCSAMIADILPGSDNISTPDSLRAHAFLTLGKFCLRDEKLAKASINVFVKELHVNMKGGSPVVQSNCLLVLGDLCMLYANLVDLFLPQMAACMQAGITDITERAAPLPREYTVVRKHAILLLSDLLLQDYIKFRGLMFHRFLVAATDEDAGVAALAESVSSVE
jgi:condensin-2 complex subunit D3